MQRMKSVTQNNLDAILRYSPFNSEKELMEQLKSFESSVTGTKIIIYNLRRLPGEKGDLELDFISVPNDIRCPEAFAKDTSDPEYRPTEYVPEYRKSLREYCSILYFKPKMRIFIRDQLVKKKCIAKMLYNTTKQKYQPNFLKKEKKTILIVLGISCEKDSKQNYGFLMYHKNRLIKAYEKVGCQKLNNEKGVAVIGVVELDFLKPIDNKQDFNQDQQYNTVMNALATKLNAYWNEAEDSGSNEQVHQPDWNWAQCFQCLKQRRLPRGTNRESLPDKWFCFMNKDQLYNRCEAEEEPDDNETSLKGNKKSKLSSSQPETLRDKFDDQRNSPRLSSSQPETINEYGGNISKSKILKDKSNSTNNKSNTNIDDFFDVDSFLAKLLKRKVPKLRLKSTITNNQSQSKSQTDGINSMEPRPGCSKDYDGPDNLISMGPPIRNAAKRNLRSKVVNNTLQSNSYSDSIQPKLGWSKDTDESDNLILMEPPVRKTAKRHLRSNVTNNITLSKGNSGSTISLKPTPGCSADSDDTVDDDFNNSTAKKRCESMRHTDDDLNTEPDEAVTGNNDSLQNYVDEYDSFILPTISTGLGTDRSEMSTQTDLQSLETGSRETELVSCKTVSRPVQTEITYDKDGNTEFHRRVHTLLTLIAPFNADLVDTSNIEEIINTLIEMYLNPESS